MAKPKSKKKRGRPVKHPLPERIDATPEEVADVVMRAKPSLTGATCSNAPSPVSPISRESGTRLILRNDFLKSRLMFASAKLRG